MVMHSTASQRFIAIADQLAPLVERGYVDNQSEIVGGLRQLAADHVAIRHFIAQCAIDPTQGDLHGAQSFMIQKCRQYAMRLNVWFPESQLPEEVRSRYEEYFSVDVFHNHNYDFFTVGVFGPGYTSDYARTASDISDLKVGDVVSFEEHWTMSLPKGEAVFVAQDAEFHVQYTPSDLSLSLNLIPTQAPGPDHCQYVLGTDRQTVSRIIKPAARPARREIGAQ